MLGVWVPSRVSGDAAVASAYDAIRLFRRDWTAQRDRGGVMFSGVLVVDIVRRLKQLVYGRNFCATSLLFAKYACFPWFLSCDPVPFC